MSHETGKIEVVGLSGGDDGIASALFPFVGGLSALCAGLSTDRTGKRSTVMIWYLVLLILATLLLAGSASFANDYSQTVRLVIALSLTALTAFALIGPYSLLSGVCSLDFGGKKGSCFSRTS
ncbi:MAG: hypothetical protein IID18_03100 [Nitrospinae bacterium]|nr:hypothetical protein [Nitrospinota bacterium]